MVVGFFVSSFSSSSFLLLCCPVFAMRRFIRNPIKKLKVERKMILKVINDFHGKKPKKKIFRLRFSWWNRLNLRYFDDLLYDSSGNSSIFHFTLICLIVCLAATFPCLFYNHIGVFSLFLSFVRSVSVFNVLLVYCS